MTFDPTIMAPLAMATPETGEDGGNLRVALRIRPLLRKELERSCNECVFADTSSQAPHPDLFGVEFFVQFFGVAGEDRATQGRAQQELHIRLRVWSQVESGRPLHLRGAASGRRLFQWLQRHRARIRPDGEKLRNLNLIPLLGLILSDRDLEKRIQWGRGCPQGRTEMA